MLRGVPMKRIVFWVAYLQCRLPRQVDLKLSQTDWHGVAMM
jgi:hypothetical protein